MNEAALGLHDRGSGALAGNWAERDCLRRTTETDEQAAAALNACQQGWADELADITRRTMIAADALDDSTLTIQQAEEQNPRAANTLLGLLS